VRRGKTRTRERERERKRERERERKRTREKEGGREREVANFYGGKTFAVNVGASVKVERLDGGKSNH
jgi:hypothetical protein